MDHVFGSKELELQHAQTVAGLMGKKSAWLRAGMAQARLACCATLLLSHFRHPSSHLSPLFPLPPCPRPPLGAPAEKVKKATAVVDDD
jgi:hypothetical protein